MKKRNTPKLDKILACVREICKSRRGKVSELANYLGLKQAGQVSNWISLKSRIKPSAESLIGILQWLREQRNSCGCETCPADGIDAAAQTAHEIISGPDAVAEETAAENVADDFVQNPSDDFSETASDHTLGGNY